VVVKLGKRHHVVYVQPQRSSRPDYAYNRNWLLLVTDTANTAGQPTLNVEKGV